MRVKSQFYENGKYNLFTKKEIYLKLSCFIFL